MRSKKRTLSLDSTYSFFVATIPSKFLDGIVAYLEQENKVFDCLRQHEKRYTLSRGWPAMPEHSFERDPMGY
jgi:hypothetical protein